MAGHPSVSPHLPMCPPYHSLAVSVAHDLHQPPGIVQILLLHRCSTLVLMSPSPMPYPPLPLLWMCPSQTHSARPSPWAILPIRSDPIPPPLLPTRPRTMQYHLRCPLFIQMRHKHRIPMFQGYIPSSIIITHCIHQFPPIVLALSERHPQAVLSLLWHPHHHRRHQPTSLYLTNMPLLAVSHLQPPPLTMVVAIVRMITQATRHPQGGGVRAQ